MRHNKLVCRKNANYKKLNWKEGTICFYCQKKITFLETTVDHILALSKGGHSGGSNLVLCCKSCNQKKSNAKVANSEQLKECVELAKRGIFLKDGFYGMGIIK